MVEALVPEVDGAAIASRHVPQEPVALVHFESMPHRPGAVRLLIYRPPDDEARVQERARNNLKRAAGAVLSQNFVISL